jgi:hypothetical protein
MAEQGIGEATMATVPVDFSHRRRLGGWETGRGGSQHREGSNLVSSAGRDSQREACASNSGRVELLAGGRSEERRRLGLEGSPRCSGVLRGEADVVVVESGSEDD